MRKSKIKLIALLVILTSFWYSLFLPKSNANPVPVISTYYGGIVPKNVYNCSMTDANVQLNVDALKVNEFGHQVLRHLNLTFMGNYTIFNPNDPINITVASPYDWEITALSNVEILVNNFTIPFDLVDIGYIITDEWDEFFYDHYSSMFFIVCNFTIPKNESIILESSFQTSISLAPIDVNEVYVNYVVGTYRGWDSPSAPSGLGITEQVKFRVHGQQPDRFSDYAPGGFSRNCTVTDIINGKSYLWRWDNETIIDGRVYIMYDINKSNSIFGYPYLGLGIFGLISVIFICSKISIKFQVNKNKKE